MLRCLSAVPFILLVAVATPVVASAQATAPAEADDRGAIASCLKEGRDSPQACIGSIALVCARRESGDRLEAEVNCTRRETTIWRERLDTTNDTLEQTLGADARKRFAAIQRAWEEYVALKCSFIGEQAPLPRAAVFQAGCQLREVATRAIEVERFLRHAERRR